MKLQDARITLEPIVVEEVTFSAPFRATITGWQADLEGCAESASGAPVDFGLRASERTPQRALEALELIMKAYDVEVES